MIPDVISVQERLLLRACKTDKFKAGMLSLSLALPIRDDAYLTTLVMAVLLRGSERYPTVAAINRRLDYLYGTEVSLRNHYCGDLHVIGLCADLVGEEYLPLRTDGEVSVMEGAIEVMRELLFHPLLDEEGNLLAHYVESEKRLQCDNIRAQKNHPHAYAAERCKSLMYEGTPGGIPILGTEEDVMAVTPQRLTAHWRAIIRNLSLDCFYVGGCEPLDVACLLKKALSGELGASLVARGSPVAVPLSLRECRSLEETQPITQSHLIMGYDIGAFINQRDFYAATVCNELLGGSPISKLFMNVREKLGLCYSCHSAYNAYRGTVMISCGLSAASRDAAQREIEAQISALAEGSITDAEWIAAKKSLENAYRQLEDSPVSLERLFFGRALAGLSVSPEECRRAIDEVTREEVVACARRMRADTVFFLRATENGEVTEDGED
ncbi:MAG: insulinase family protein [Ruminococcaceae bacterium]|nr:insulinase family protein [Oscillospiraceae bacterium]